MKLRFVSFAVAGSVVGFLFNLSFGARLEGAVAIAAFAFLVTLAIAYTLRACGWFDL